MNPQTVIFVASTWHSYHASGRLSYQRQVAIPTIFSVIWRIVSAWYGYFIASNASKTASVRQTLYHPVTTIHVLGGPSEQLDLNQLRLLLMQLHPGRHSYREHYTRFIAFRLLTTGKALERGTNKEKLGSWASRPMYSTRLQSSLVAAFPLFTSLACTTASLVGLLVAFLVAFLVALISLRCLWRPSSKIVLYVNVRLCRLSCSIGTPGGLAVPSRPLPSLSCLPPPRPSCPYPWWFVRTVRSAWIVIGHAGPRCSVERSGYVREANLASTNCRNRRVFVRMKAHRIGCRCRRRLIAKELYKSISVWHHEWCREWFLVYIEKIALKFQIRTVD